MRRGFGLELRRGESSIVNRGPAPTAADRACRCQPLVSAAGRGLAEVQRLLAVALIAAIRPSTSKVISAVLPSGKCAWIRSAATSTGTPW